MSEEDCSSEYSFTSNSSGSYEVLKIRQYRTDYESDEHWEIKKVKICKFDEIVVKFRACVLVVHRDSLGKLRLDR